MGEAQTFLSLTCWGSTEDSFWNRGAAAERERGEEEFLNFLFIAFWVTKFSPFSFESYNSFIPFSEKEAKIRESRNVFIVTQGMAELGHELGSSDSKFRTPALQQGRVRASD